MHNCPLSQFMFLCTWLLSFLPSRAKRIYAKILLIDNVKANMKKKARSHTSVCVTEDPIPSCPKSFRPVENTRPLSAPKDKGKSLLHYDASPAQTGKDSNFPSINADRSVTKANFRLEERDIVYH